MELLTFPHGKPLKQWRRIPWSLKAVSNAFSFLFFAFCFSILAFYIFTCLGKLYYLRQYLSTKFLIFMEFC